MGEGTALGTKSVCFGVRIHCFQATQSNLYDGGIVLISGGGSCVISLPLRASHCRDSFSDVRVQNEIS